MSRGRFRGGPCPRGAGVRRFILCVRDGDVRDLVARRRTQSDDVRERAADHLQVRIDGRRGGGMCCASELTAQRCANHAAHLLGGEFGFGKEVAELRQRALPTKRTSE